MPGVVRGCPVGSVCKVQVQAPALFPTNCARYSIENDYNTPISFTDVFAGTTAPPLKSDAFILQPSLLLGERESVNLITGYSTGENCVMTLNYSICTLEAGIGEYTMFVENDHARVDEESSLKPGFVAFANNTAVNHTWVPGLGNPSTLGGVVAKMFARYNMVAFYQRSGGKDPDIGDFKPIPMFMGLSYEKC